MRAIACSVKRCLAYAKSMVKDISVLECCYLQRRPVKANNDATLVDKKGEVRAGSARVSGGDEAGRMQR